jgi:hypothetical protein
MQSLTDPAGRDGLRPRRCLRLPAQSHAFSHVPALRNGELSIRKCNLLAKNLAGFLSTVVTPPAEPDRTRHESPEEHLDTEMARWGFAVARRG